MLREDILFGEYSILQDTDGFVSGLDAVLLAAYTAAHPGEQGAELGAGSGMAVLLRALRSPGTAFRAVEVREGPYHLLCRNIGRCGLDGRVEPVLGDARDPALLPAGAFDFVMMNPPYLAGGKLNASSDRASARHELNGGVAELLSASARLLKNGGRLYAVYRPARLAALLSAMERAGVAPKELRFVHARRDAEASLVLCRGARGGGEGMKTMPPLVLTENGEDSAEMRAVYERGALDG